MHNYKWLFMSFSGINSHHLYISKILKECIYFIVVSHCCSQAFSEVKLSPFEKQTNFNLVLKNSLQIKWRSRGLTVKDHGTRRAPRWAEGELACAAEQEQTAGLQVWDLPVTEYKISMLNMFLSKKWWKCEQHLRNQQT